MAFLRDPNCLTPIMTSSTTPSGIVFTSGYYGDSYPYNAFNGTDGNWVASEIDKGGVFSPTGYIGYDFGIAIISDKYNILPSSNTTTVNFYPKTWTYEGWNGTAWVVLDAKTNITNWVLNQANTYIINNTVAYSKYRLNITESAGNILFIVEFEISNTTYVPPLKSTQRAQAIGGF